MKRRAVLLEALRRAGRVLKRRFGKVTYREKGRANLVTVADLESQREILSAITRAFPEDDFKAEEDQVRLMGAEHLWIIDPLDGTTNYAHGYPASCVSIGVLRRGRPALAGVYDPSRDELFLAEKGRGTTLNSRRVRVSAASRLEDSLLVTGFAYDRDVRADFYLKRFKSFLVRCHDVRRSGSAALDMAWIAAGRADGFWEYKLSPWDVAAGWLLVSEAGGKVTNFSGRPWGAMPEMGAETLASNGRIHAAMLKTLRAAVVLLALAAAGAARAATIEMPLQANWDDAVSWDVTATSQRAYPNPSSNPWAEILIGDSSEYYKMPNIRTYFRFKLGLPPFARVKSARIVFHCSAGGKGTPKLDVRYVESDAPSFQGQPWALPLSATAVRWDTDEHGWDWTTHGEYRTPDLTPLVEEFVRRYGTEATIGFVISNRPENQNNFKGITSFDDEPQLAAKLVVEVQ